MIIIQLSAQSGCDDELLTFSFYFFGPLKIPRKTQKKSFRPNKKNFFLHFLLLVLILVEREREEGKRWKTYYFINKTKVSGSSSSANKT